LCSGPATMRAVKRQQLAHLLRSACAVAHDVDILVLGSQSILGSFDEEDLPPEATASLEADIAFLDDPRRDKADEVEGAIGEMSTFHEENGIYAEGVHIEVAILPDGWKDRLVSWDLQSSKPAEPLSGSARSRRLKTCCGASEGPRLRPGAHS
jgi:hypothetical protein